VNGLRMDYRMEVRSTCTDLIIMNGEMRIKLTGYTLKAVMRSRVKFSCIAAFVDKDAGNAGGGFINDFTQAPTRAAHEEGRSHQFRNRLWQFNLIHNRE